jgi:hypothetical protein
MRRILRAPEQLLVLGTLFGCSETLPSSPAGEISYGVEDLVVSLTSLEAGLAADGPALLLPDGSVVVSDPSNGSVVWVAEQVLRTGREGAGPGEFQRISRILPYRGDSILVHDSRLARTTVMGLEPGGLSSGRSFRLMDEEGEIFVPVGSQRDGSIIGEHRNRVPTGSGPVRASVGIALFDEHGAFRRFAGHFLGREEFLLRLEGSRGQMDLFFTSPLGARWTPAPLEDGVVVPVGDTLVKLMDGARAGHTLAPSSTRRVPRQIHDQVRALAVPDGGDPGLLREVATTVPIPARTPPFGRILPGREGHLWLERVPLPSDSLGGFWYRVDWRGGTSASLSLPPGDSLLGIQEPLVLLSRPSGAAGERDVQIRRLGPRP